MVTSSLAFDERLALGTSLDVAPGKPFLQQAKFLLLGIRTFLALVMLDVTVSAYADKAGRALQNSVWWSGAVDLLTVGRWTIVELGRP